MCLSMSQEYIDGRFHYEREGCKAGRPTELSNGVNRGLVGVAQAGMRMGMGMGMGRPGGMWKRRTLEAS
jgi:hypothetical protein